MISKIIHIADIHYRNIQRHDEYRAVIDNFLYQLKQIRPQRLVIAGDIVHSRNQMSPELFEEVFRFLGECCNWAELVIVIPGNHDIVEQNSERMDALTPIIEAIERDNIMYIKDSTIFQDENVAWINYSIFHGGITPDGTRDITDKIKIGLFHGIINGAVNDIGFTFDYGSDLNKFDVCDITLCGDIHKRQVLTTKSGKSVIYPGSLIQQNFGESVSEHGFNEITIDGNNIDFKFHNIENPIKYLKFKITDFSDIEEGKERLVNV